MNHLTASQSWVGQSALGKCFLENFSLKKDGVGNFFKMRMITNGKAGFESWFICASTEMPLVKTRDVFLGVCDGTLIRREGDETDFVSSNDSFMEFCESNGCTVYYVVMDSKTLHKSGRVSHPPIVAGFHIMDYAYRRAKSEKKIPRIIVFLREASSSFIFALISELRSHDVQWHMASSEVPQMQRKIKSEGYLLRNNALFLEPQMEKVKLQRHVLYQFMEVLGGPVLILSDDGDRFGERSKECDFLWFCELTSNTAIPREQ